MNSTQTTSELLRRLVASTQTFSSALDSLATLEHNRDEIAEAEFAHRLSVRFRSMVVMLNYRHKELTGLNATATASELEDRRSKVGVFAHPKTKIGVKYGEISEGFKESMAEIVANFVYEDEITAKALELYIAYANDTVDLVGRRTGTVKL